jgi:hypothetical protein
MNGGEKKHSWNSGGEPFCKEATCSTKGVNVKLSLWLTNYNATKTHLLFHYAPCHKDIWGTGAIAPRDPNNGTRQR